MKDDDRQKNKSYGCTTMRRDYLIGISRKNLRRNRGWLRLGIIPALFVPDKR